MNDESKWFSEWKEAVLALLTLIGFLLLVSSISSCKKCADCTVTVTQKVTGQPATTGTSTTELCGDNLKEADGNTTTSTSTVSGYTATITTYTTCE